MNDAFGADEYFSSCSQFSFHNHSVLFLTYLPQSAPEFRHNAVLLAPLVPSPRILPLLQFALLGGQPTARAARGAQAAAENRNKKLCYKC